MIIGNIDKLADEFNSYPPAIKRGLQFLRETDFTKLPPGRYEIDGDAIYATLQHYQTRCSDECRPEAHEKYIDIQYVVKGSEYLGWCVAAPDLEIDQTYDAAKDLVFYKKLLPESNVLLTERMFAVLYPQDVHRPCCMVDNASPVIKVVVKIAVSCLEK